MLCLYTSTCEINKYYNVERYTKPFMTGIYTFYMYK